MLKQHPSRIAQIAYRPERYLKGGSLLVRVMLLNSTLIRSLCSRAIQTDLNLYIFSLTNLTYRVPRCLFKTN